MVKKNKKESASQKVTGPGQAGDPEKTKKELASKWIKQVTKKESLVQFNVSSEKDGCLYKIWIKATNKPVKIGKKTVRRLLKRGSVGCIERYFVIDLSAPDIMKEISDVRLQIRTFMQDCEIDAQNTVDRLEKCEEFFESIMEMVK